MNNMKLLKKIITLIILSLFLGSSVLSSTGNIIIEETTSKESEINMIDETTIELSIITPTFEFESTSTVEGLFATIKIPGEGFTTCIGEAKLPLLKYMLEIPVHAEPEISITSIDWQETSLEELNLPSKILPVQPSLEKVPNAQSEFVIDHNYYSNNVFNPSQITQVTDIGDIRGHRFALIEVSPIQYNPLQGTLRTMKNCKIKINLPGSDMTQTYEKIARYTTPAFETLFKNLFDNYGYYEQNIIPIDIEGYLIIVYDNFYDAIQPLADLKSSRGFDTTVTKTSDIPGGATKENIQAYIEEAYNEWTIPPSYILLVGDTPQVPTYTGTTGPSAVDLYYVTINQGDYFPDIFIGRFPAAQESQVDAMVDKTVYYEKGIFNSTDWINKSTFMAGEDNYHISEGTHNYVIETYLEPNNYTCDKLYMVTYGATTQDVKNSLNNGRSLAIYSGHGSSTSWADGPQFSQSDVNSLTNKDMYPFVCSHACLTGTFNIGECFGETWLRAADKAGLAFWGASASTLWNEDDILERGMFQAWWDDNLETISGMTDMALYYLYENYSGGGYTKYYYECYNILGDPSITIWQSNPNYPPETPGAPNGPNEGITGEESSFTARTIDPEGYNIYYMFSWGDNTSSDWIGPYESGDYTTDSHIWESEGMYEVRVMAKDENGSVSKWSDPTIINILQAPLLDIGMISGGFFKVKSAISNKGSIDATEVNWSIQVTGGVFFGKETTGICTLIKADNEEKIISNPIIGFGEIQVKVSAAIPKSEDTRTQQGKIYLFYLFVIPSGG